MNSKDKIELIKDQPNNHTYQMPSSMQPTTRIIHYMQTTFVAEARLG